MDEVILERDISTQGKQNANLNSKLVQWIFERIRPFAVGHMLEISDKQGSIAPIFEEQGFPVNVMSINLENITFQTSYSNMFGAFDTVIAFNENEKIGNNEVIVSNCTKLLKSGGYLFLLLPAHTALYNGLQHGFDQWNIYNWRYVNKKIGAGYEIMKMRYFIVLDNLSTINEISRYMEQVAIFNKGDMSTFSPTGLSILIICKKK